MPVILSRDDTAGALSEFSFSRRTSGSSAGWKWRLCYNEWVGGRRPRMKEEDGYWK